MKYGVFIHRSIKTRIETQFYLSMKITANQFLYIDPLKQGLKPAIQDFSPISRNVFIHRSIKTRIETCPPNDTNHQTLLFLYIDPLKQGLKHFTTTQNCFLNEFLYIDPLKQGLKLRTFLKSSTIYFGFYT